MGKRGPQPGTSIPSSRRLKISQTVKAKNEKHLSYIASLEAQVASLLVQSEPLNQIAELESLLYEYNDIIEQLYIDLESEEQDSRTLKIERKRLLNAVADLKDLQNTHERDLFEQRVELLLRIYELEAYIEQLRLDLEAKEDEVVIEEVAAEPYDQKIIYLEALNFEILRRLKKFVDNPPLPPPTKPPRPLTAGQEFARKAMLQELAIEIPVVVPGTKIGKAATKDKKERITSIDIFASVPGERTELAKDLPIIFKAAVQSKLEK